LQSQKSFAWLAACVSILGAVYIALQAPQQFSISSTQSRSIRNSFNQDMAEPLSDVWPRTGRSDQNLPAQKGSSDRNAESKTHETEIGSNSEPQVSPPTIDPPAKLFVDHSAIGFSVQGEILNRIQLGDGDYVVLIIASIHGTEIAGTPLCGRLVEELQQQPQLLAGRTVVILPMVNPDGAKAGSRYNARGVDLNRNFAAKNRENSKRYGMEALSEPESVAIFRTIEEFQPRQIVTLHQPLQCVDYDGPAKSLAEAMSQVCPLPVKKLGSRPGSLGSYAGVTLKIPTITFELPKNAARQSTELLWQFYGPALLAAIEFQVPDR
jgi:murein peptide amidase A